MFLDLWYYSCNHAGMLRSEPTLQLRDSQSTAPCGPVLKSDCIIMSIDSRQTDASQRTTILIVEDDASLRLSVESFLHDNGYAVYSVGTKKAGWETLKRVEPTLVLLDLNLPDGSGLDLIRQIDREKLPVKVIIMSAMPTHHLQPDVGEKSLVASLTKPIDPATLLAAVEKATCNSPQVVN